MYFDLTENTLDWNAISSSKLYNCPAGENYIIYKLDDLSNQYDEYKSILKYLDEANCIESINWLDGLTDEPFFLSLMHDRIDENCTDYREVMFKHNMGHLSYYYCPQCCQAYCENCSAKHEHVNSLLPRTILLQEHCSYCREIVPKPKDEIVYYSTNNEEKIYVCQSCAESENIENFETLQSTPEKPFDLIKYQCRMGSLLDWAPIMQNKGPKFTDDHGCRNNMEIILMNINPTSPMYKRHCLLKLEGDDCMQYYILHNDDKVLENIEKLFTKYDTDCDDDDSDEN